MNLVSKLLLNKKILLTVLGSILLSSCGGSSGGSDSPASSDTVDPTASILFPSANVLVDGNEIIVRGSATDNSSTIDSVLVNGVAATSNDGFQSWSASVPLTRGMNSLTVEVSDSAGNTNTSAAQIQIQNELFSAGFETLTIDATNNRILVIDRYLRAVVSVDLLTGQREILSGPGVPNNNNFFIRPESIVLDINNNRALVIDGGARKLFSVDLTTGERAILSGNNIPSTANPFSVFNPGIALDSKRNRALVVSQSLVPNLGAPVFSPVNPETSSEILAVDLGTGQRSVLSSETLPDSTNKFIRPSSIIVDPLSDRAIVLEQKNRASLISIDLITGSRSIFSDNTQPNNLNTFGYSFGFALDEKNSRYIVSKDSVEMLGVDVVTGERSVLANVLPLSDNLTSVSSPTPSRVAVDGNGDKVITLSSDGESVGAVDLASGVQSTLTMFSHVPDANNIIRFPASTVLDPNANRLITLTPFSGMASVDLATGDRSIFSEVNTNFLSIAHSNGVVSDAETNQVYFFIRENLFSITNFDFALIKFDLTTGELSKFSDNLAPNDVIPFVEPRSFALDKTKNRLLVIDDNALIAVDLDSGDRSKVSDLPDLVTAIPGAISVSNGGNYSAITIDEINNKAILVAGFGTVVEFNLDTEAVTTLSNSTVIGVSAASGPFSSIALDADNNRVLVIELGRIVSVDLTSGARTIFSDQMTPNSNSLFVAPQSISVDNANHRAFVTDSILNAIYEIDLQTGERAIFSR